jgi:tetratricopeptide (TPR) repeat protein
MGTLNNLGLLNLYQERWAVAIPHFREALALELAAHGENHPNEALLRSNLSWCLSGERRFEEAEREGRRAAEVGRKVLGPLHMVTEYAEYRWGWALQHLGRLDEAEAVQRGALAAREKTRQGSPFHEIVASQHTLARLLRWKGELPEAIALYRAAIGSAKREFPDPGDPEILRAEAELADTLAQAGRTDEAHVLIERVMRDLASREPGFAAHEAAVVHGGLLARKPATRERAGEILNAALAALDGGSHDSRLARRQALAALARLAESNGQRDEAVRRWREALAYESELTPGEPERGRAARELERLESR